MQNQNTGETFAQVTISNAQVLVSKKDSSGEVQHQLVDVYFASLLSVLADPKKNIGVELIRATLLNKSVLPVQNRVNN